MNLNEMAEEVSKKEGKKISLSIAQIKEVLKIVLRILKDMEYGEVADLLKRIKP